VSDTGSSHWASSLNIACMCCIPFVRQSKKLLHRLYISLDSTIAFWLLISFSHISSIIVWPFHNWPLMRCWWSLFFNRKHIRFDFYCLLKQWYSSPPSYKATPTKDHSPIRSDFRWTKNFKLSTSKEATPLIRPPFLIAECIQLDKKLHSDTLSRLNQRVLAISSKWIACFVEK